MFLKKCRCGKSEKNFKVDIGPFFIDDCCEAAGYNEKGELVVQKQGASILGEKTGDKSPEDVDAEIQKVLDEGPKDLQIVDEGEQPDPDEARLATPEEVEAIEKMEVVQETVLTTPDPEPAAKPSRRGRRNNGQPQGN